MDVWNERGVAMNKKLYYRWWILTLSVAAMLFAGILYAWSILKSPFASEFGWSPSDLALNFTLAMCFFCIGGLLGARLAKAWGHKLAIICAGIGSAIGFILTAMVSGDSILVLYLTYGVLAGLGIGIAYNVVISTVSAWFPDKKGLCSGCLMMGFGASALVIGNVANAMFNSSLGWRTAYWILGIAIGAVLIITALILKKPDANMPLPKPVASKKSGTEEFTVSDYTSKQMLKRPSFWMAFAFITFLAATGSSVISFAKDLALSVHSPESLAVTLVGVLSVCNGFGRILTGAIFDILGRRKTLLIANFVTIGAAGITLLSVTIGSLPLCIIGLCITGISYGACPTITAAFTSAFYGMKNFSSNMACMTFTSMCASLIATVSNNILESTGGYTVPFLMLLSLSIVALILNLFIRRP